MRAWPGAAAWRLSAGSAAPRGRGHACQPAARDRASRGPTPPLGAGGHRASPPAPARSAPTCELAHQELDRPLELGQRGLLDAVDPELAVEPCIDLPVAGAVPAPDLRHQPVALVTQTRPPLEGRRLGRFGDCMTWLWPVGGRG